MSLRDRLLEIDRHLAGAHLVLNDISSFKAIPADRTLSAAIADLTRAREMLTDLADGPTEN